MKNGKLLKTCLFVMMLGITMYLWGKTGFFAKAEEQTGTYVIDQAGAEVNAELKFDTLKDEWFLSGEKEYNPQLARLSALLSMLCYKEYSGTPSGIVVNGTRMDMCAYMEYLGFSDVRDVELPLEADENTIHHTEIYIGHKDIGGKKLLAVMVRGTNGTADEWLSNFDLGFDNAKSDKLEDMNNHEGFEITSMLVYDYIHDYKEELSIDDETYWISGHSRGGAIANLLAAKLCDDGKRNYTYTIAAPGCTMHKDVGEEKYQCIFNIVNRDDLIPVVPLGSWGFMLYGRTAMLSMTKADMEAFKNACTREDKPFKYNGDEKKVKRFSDVFASFIAEGSSPVKSLNTLQCFHVTGVKGTGVSILLDTKDAGHVFESIPEDARKKCHMVVSEEDPEKTYICVPPVALIQCFRAMFDRNLSGDARSDNLKLLTNCDQLSELVVLIVQMSLNDFMTAPHMPYSYYLLASEAKASDFVTEPVKKPYEPESSDPGEKESSTKESSSKESSTKESSTKSSSGESGDESSADENAKESSSGESVTESSEKKSSSDSTGDENIKEGDKETKLPMLIIFGGGALLVLVTVSLIVVKVRKGKAKTK